MGESYPSVVEFGLNSNIVSFFFILGSQHLELSGLQRTETLLGLHWSVIGFQLGSDLSASAASGPR